MGFLDSLDGNLNDLAGNLNYLKKKLVSESQEIKKTARLKYEILNEERKISELFEALGRHQYKLIRGEDSQLDIDKTLSEIDKHKSRISSLKMGLDLSDNRSYINFTDSKENSGKSESTSIFIKDDLEREDDKDSIIFIKEDEDES
ncbi:MULTISPECIES: hypothetical protein [Peptoniphilus]|uniref:hypothetical protein n=1 Tax=Peptoniphilus TaxID=162289 RepID=UPI000306F23E|nr:MULTISPECIES: hypothetical protein [Peptoniphilus]